MEKLCKIRDIQRAVNQFEQGFEKRYGICLNEGMASGEIGELLGLSSSNASKVIKSIENKRLVERMTGEKDKRQMYFSLTPDGKKRISSLQCEAIEIAPLLKEMLEKR